MKRFLAPTLAGLMCYVIFLVATIPATFINTLLAHYVDQNIQVANAQGTLWHGSGSLYGMEEISWRIKVPELFLGHLHVLVMNKDAAQPMDVFISPARIELKHVSLTLPATLLSDFAQPLKLMAPGGLLSLSTEAFSVSNTFLGSVNLDWQNASSALSRVSPIGTYHFHVIGLGHHLNIHLDTQDGPLFLAGKGTWSLQSGLYFTGTASSENEQFSALLNLIGKPAENGTYSIHIGPQ
ncbi:MAG: type II secretion system protein N [Betaproteobacteria bacterium]|nr:type II secretion system protein N [Betaproteobacteria bacterium]